MASYSTMNTVPAADVESETPLLSRDIKVNAKTLIGGAAAAAFALGALAATAVASAPQPAPAALYTAPRAPAAFYSAPRAPAAFAAHSSRNLQFKLDGSEGKNGKCLGVEDHNDVSDGTKLIMWDCVDNAVGQEFTFDGDRLMYDGKCATFSPNGVTLESCSSDDANQDIQVMFNKEYTHNIKFTGFGDYCLTGHSGPDAKDRVVYGETCDHLKQHWDIIKL